MKTNVNSRVKELREALRLSQTEFASIADVSSSTISKIERGEIEVSFDVIESICSKWSVPENWLVEGKGQMKFVKITKPTSMVDPYQDVLYRELKEQIAFLRETIKSLTAGRAGFRKATSITDSLIDSLKYNVPNKKLPVALKG